MNAEDKEYFLLWSQTDEYQQKLKEAQSVIKQALKDFNKPYIAYSGGKDSTALMYMVLSLNDSVTVVHWDYGRYYIPRPLHEEIISIARKCGAKNLLVFTSSLYKKLGRKAQGVLGKHFIGVEIPKLIEQGYDSAFLGLRAEESVKRRLRTEGFYEYDRRGITNIFPLRNWTYRDVWAYIVSNDVPYLRSYYDKYAPLLGYEKTRFVTLFDPEFDRFGSSYIDKFLMWRYYNPE
jgi:3'-phosphoadenosine 5'-phosphosulfate sulfotransferase (PAPS reductase)/FAD synthetase